MATVDGLSKARMLEIEANSVVDGDVVGDNLVLTKHDGSTIQAGSVRGPQGTAGTNGTNAMAGNRWSSLTAYVVNDTVGYSGRLYTCIVANTDKCPAFNNNYWRPVTGASTEVWPLTDPYFMAEDLDAYELFWRSGTVAASLTQTAGEFESGYQALKLVMAASSTQRIYDRGEVVVRGNEVITVTVRAKITAAATVPPVVSIGLFQAPKDGLPEPFGASAAEVGGAPLYGTLGTNWATFTFTVSAALAKPRARLNVLFQQAAGNGSTIVVDRIEISRFAYPLSLKADKTTTDTSFRSLRMQPLRQRLMTGGGIRKVNATGVSWSQRLIIMGLGQSMAASGYHQILMPPDGTVIPVYGGSAATSVTVAGGVIPILGWRTLYYDIDPAVNISSADRFKLMDYNLATTQEVPDTWLFIVTRNVDTMACNYMWGDGRAQDYWRLLTLKNSWTAYNASFPAPAWRFTTEGKVETHGLMKGGTVGLATPFATLPYPELAPDGGTNSGLILLALANAGSYSARIDILPTTGDMSVLALGTGATNAYVSLDNLSWRPAGT